MSVPDSSTDAIITERGPFRASRKLLVLLCLAGAASAAIGIWLGFLHNTPRDQAVDLMGRIDRSLSESDGDTLVALVHPSPAFSHRTRDEKKRWLAEVLRSEISPEGLAILEREGQFGPLIEVFPARGPRWAEIAGAPLEKCSAFRLERGAIQAEVVFVETSEGIQLLRCNNVSQLALVQ